MSIIKIGIKKIELGYFPLELGIVDEKNYRILHFLHTTLFSYSLSLL
jgi:hypothetical protein